MKRVKSYSDAYKTPPADAVVDYDATGTIGEAMKWIEAGYEVRRKGWKGQSRVCNRITYWKGKKYPPQLMLREEWRLGEWLSWHAEQSDMMASDWVIYRPQDDAGALP